GLAEMNRRISNTAEFGEYVSGTRVINEGVRDAMRGVLSDIENGKFSDKWMKENEDGCKEFMKMREDSAAHPIEKTGAKLRKMMSWLKK
ncbi:MAG: ketol-acid reductoisomerase, partial [bacterium]|nr:ketol-acid reductoisomerase [bacterium]